MKVRVSIVLKKTVLDPQGQAIAMSLKNQGFSQVENVRQGKIIDIEFPEFLDIGQILVKIHYLKIFLNQKKKF